jgi:hypothetical protein
VVKAGKSVVGGKKGGNRKAKPDGGIEYAIEHPVIGITGIASVLKFSHPESPPDSSDALFVFAPQGKTIKKSIP